MLGMGSVAGTIRLKTEEEDDAVEDRERKDGGQT